MKKKTALVKALFFISLEYKNIFCANFFLDKLDTADLTEDDRIICTKYEYKLNISSTNKSIEKIEWSALSATTAPNSPEPFGEPSIDLETDIEQGTLTLPNLSLGEPAIPKSPVPTLESRSVFSPTLENLTPRDDKILSPSKIPSSPVPLKRSLSGSSFFYPKTFPVDEPAIPAISSEKKGPILSSPEESTLLKKRKTKGVYKRPK